MSTGIMPESEVFKVSFKMHGGEDRSTEVMQRNVVASNTRHAYAIVAHHAPTDVTLEVISIEYVDFPVFVDKED